MTIKGTAAYFISPTGKTLNVPTSHIASVIKDPLLFGLTTSEIEAAYKKHAEPLGLEGKARHEILLKIIKSGWIRLRRYQNQHWSVTVNNLSEKTIRNLNTWKRDILSGALGLTEADSQMPVLIKQLDTRTEHRESLDTISDCQ